MSSEINHKAQGIRLLVLDVDGILTPGNILVGANCEEYRSFNMQDGLGIRLLMSAGIELALISGRNSAQVAYRAKDLGIEHAHLGHVEKLPVFNKLCESLALTYDQVAYMGDDIIDLPLLKRAGLAITVPNAHPRIPQYADYITGNPGGHGAVREVIDLILDAQDKLEGIINNYLDSGNLLKDV